METFFNNKRISISVFILIIIISIFTLARFVNEVKQNKYIGRNNQGVNTIYVSGTGEVLAVSDIASLYITLSKEGKTAKESQDLLNESIKKTLTFLKEQKINDKDIKSEYGGLNPKYSYEQPVCLSYPCPAREPRIVGYTSTQSITVKVRAVDTASEIRTGLAEIGVTNISGPTFSIDDEDAFKDEARSIAIKNAKEKAKLLAQELGVKLGKIVSFSENTGGYYPVYSSMKSSLGGAEMVSLDSAAPTLPKGENKIISNISITYEIK